MERPAKEWPPNGTNRAHTTTKKIHLNQLPRNNSQTDTHTPASGSTTKKRGRGSKHNDPILSQKARALITPHTARGQRAKRPLFALPSPQPSIQTPRKLCPHVGAARRQLPLPPLIAICRFYSATPPLRRPTLARSYTTHNGVPTTRTLVYNNPVSRTGAAAPMAAPTFRTTAARG